MVILKKIQASTLMETLVATVLIVLIFMLASMILNNLFSSTVNGNTQAIENHLNELQYLQLHKQLKLPYRDTFQNWDVSVDIYYVEGDSIIDFEAKHLKTAKTLIKSSYANQ